MRKVFEISRQFQLNEESGCTVFSYSSLHGLWSVDPGCRAGKADDMASYLRRMADTLEELNKSLVDEK